MVAQIQTISVEKNPFEKAGGFPALSGSGGFLLKDIVLLGAALFTLGDSLRW